MVIDPGGTGIANVPANATPFMMFFLNYCQADYVAFGLTNGHPFGLVSVDLADPQIPNATSLSIWFKGFKANGSIVTNIFTTPGNGAVTLENYAFSSEFASGLTNVEIHSSGSAAHPGWAMDNLVVVNGTMPPQPAVPTSPRFGAAVNFPVAGNPTALVVADFNRDGKPDVTVSIPNGVSFLFGAGNGTFSSPTNYAVAGSGALAAGDFNNDGRIDIVSAGYGGGSVLLGDGAGHFVKTNFNFSLYSPSAIAVGDFNGDGNLDMAITGNSVTAAFGNGDGSFGSRTNYGSNVYDIFAGDLNGDGILDLAAVAYSGNCVFMNRGDGTFATPLYYQTSYGANVLVSGDFNNDGILDMAVLNPNPGSITVRLNNGRWFWSTRDYSLGLSYPTSATAADINGDGNIDLLVRSGSTLGILLGNGDGTFTSGPQLAVPSGNGLRSIALADVNGDGLPDIVLTGNNSVVVLLNQTPPVLKMTSMTGYNQISWANISAAFTLECTTNLSAPDSWQPFPYPPVIIGDHKAVTDWVNTGQKFYRLRKP